MNKYFIVFLVFWIISFLNLCSALSDTSQNLDTNATGFIFLSIIGSIWIAIIRYKKKKAIEKMLRNQDRLEYFANNGITSITNHNFLLKDGEDIYSYVPVSLKQIRHKTTYKGQSSRVALKLSKGLSIGISENITTPNRNTYLSEEGDGVLFITNKRIVFNGLRNISYPFDKIADIKIFEDGLAILGENESNMKMFESKDAVSFEYFASVVSFLTGKAIE